MAGFSLCPRGRLGPAITGSLVLVVAGTACQFQADRPTDRELDCLARNIYHEARGESLRGQRAVADVTLNRVADRRWPNTLCEVVWQPYQFSWTHDHLSDEMRDQRAREVAVRVAREALDEGPALDATHYHAAYIYPYWARSLEHVETIGLHLFYK